KAMAAGAAACVLDTQIENISPVLVVKDTRLALGQLAAYWRNKFDLPVVAVTGSNGKTTVKEMLHSIFSQQGAVLATRGNLNNDIGVPLTLFRLDEYYKNAVIEMGANHPGEIAYLARLAKPSVAVITNAAAAHLEGFGSLQGVAKAKGEIYSALPDGGCAVINADDEFVEYWKQLVRSHSAKIKILCFGIKNTADIFVDKASLNSETVVVNTPIGSFNLKLPLLGQHNLLNSLAATAAAIAAGVELNDICSGLENMKAVAGRLQLKPGINGSRIIDDTYNANPASMKAALDVLSQFKGRHYFALGDMGELGASEQALHQQVSQQAMQSGVDQLFTLGKLGRVAAQAFGEKAVAFDSHAEMINILRERLNEDVTLLVKGSRRMQMEKIVNALISDGSTGGETN
ncbi:MAG: UDP-N-acetylmuramoyl-tripeptide--D-alanyl-D-alanine ligase, partial [Gammaproteobacteria bacterium]|nr:UDP-N-acetylmuramoyl-tripeptide--D-alanyl-D-alanine ligase [Gammaproteobacteria bacterium]